jgi:hypothetical protein
MFVKSVVNETVFPRPGTVTVTVTSRNVTLGCVTVIRPRPLKRAVPVASCL